VNCRHIGQTKECVVDIKIKQRRNSGKKTGNTEAAREEHVLEKSIRNQGLPLPVVFCARYVRNRTLRYSESPDEKVSLREKGSKKRTKNLTKQEGKHRKQFHQKEG
jgi:hypothetical protein